MLKDKKKKILVLIGILFVFSLGGVCLYQKQNDISILDDILIPLSSGEWGKEEASAETEASEESVASSEEEEEIVVVEQDTEPELPEESEKPVATPSPTSKVAPTSNPEPTVSPVPTQTPAPTQEPATPAPTQAPIVSPSPEPTITPIPKQRTDLPITDFVVDTFADLKNVQAVEGETVTTRGYYEVNDGGEAIYEVGRFRDASDDYFVIDLANGLKAKMIILNNKVYVKQIGAVGDGVTDDAPRIQAALSKTGRIVLESGKNYCLKKGLNFPSYTDIEGNNSTFTINDFSFYKNESNPRENGGVGLYYYQFFFPEKYYDEGEYLGISNLTVDWNCEKDLNHVTTYFLLKVSQVKEACLDHFNVNVNGNPNNSIQPIDFKGHSDKLVIKNCSVINRTRGYKGSCVWVQANLPEGYPDVEISDCYFYSSAADEILSSYGAYRKNIVVNNCTFERNSVLCVGQDRNHTLVSDIALVHKSIANEVTPEGAIGPCYLTYNNCDFNVYSSDGNKIKAFIVLSSRYGAEVKCSFVNCNIKGDFSQAIVSGESNTAYDSNAFPDNKTYKDSIFVDFTNCNLDITAPSFISSRSANCGFYGCNIHCSESFIDMTYASNALAVCSKSEILNNHFTVQAGAGVTLLKNLKEKYLNEIIFKNNVIDYYGNLELVSYSDAVSPRVEFRHTEGAISDIQISDNQLIAK